MSTAHRTVQSKVDEVGAPPVAVVLGREARERNDSNVAAARRIQAQRRGNKTVRRPEGESPKPKARATLDADDKEADAAVKLQARVRGHSARRVREAKEEQAWREWVEYCAPPSPPPSRSVSPVPDAPRAGATRRRGHGTARQGQGARLAGVELGVRRRQGGQRHRQAAGLGPRPRRARSTRCPPPQPWRRRQAAGAVPRPHRARGMRLKGGAPVAPGAGSRRVGRVLCAALPAPRAQCAPNA